jgi:5'-nucleotidase
MRILLTNDDGIHAIGLQTLRKVLSKSYDITLVAPDRQKSASGHGITVHKPLRVDKISYGNTTGYAVSGTPADCVKLALEELLPYKPDLIVSGINSGPNLGTDVLYSGTVSAAIEGIISEVPSIAVSLVLESDNNNNYLTAANFIAKLAPIVIKKGLLDDTIVNVNVPDLESEKIKGIKITRLGVRKYINCVEKRKDPRGKNYYWLGGEVKDIEVDNDDSIITDIKAVSDGYISVSPVHFDLTNYNIIKELETWNIN